MNQFTVWFLCEVLVRSRSTFRKDCYVHASATFFYILSSFIIIDFLFSSITFRKKNIIKRQQKKNYFSFYPKGEKKKHTTNIQFPFYFREFIHIKIKALNLVSKRSIVKEITLFSKLIPFDWYTIQIRVEIPSLKYISASPSPSAN